MFKHLLSRFICSLALVALAFMPAGRVSADSSILSSTFTYQGYLTNTGGPINGLCDMQFSLFDAAAAGSQIGSTLTKTNVSLNNGTFTVQLDFGGAAFDGSDRYLQIAVRCPAGSGSYAPLTPRQPLTPAPYSLFAERVPWSGLTGLSCTAGQIPKWNGTAWTCASDSGAVGSFWSLGGNLGTMPGTNFLGTTDNQALEFKVNSLRVLRLEPNATSPNVIGGYNGNTVTFGVYGASIGGGGDSTGINQVSGNFGTVAGGWKNQATQFASTVGGGFGNVASGGTVAGGAHNTASGSSSMVGGGIVNVASGNKSVIGGGESNTASGGYSVLGGGLENKASGDFSTIGGGQTNWALGNNSTIGGGTFNAANAGISTVGGGDTNSAGGIGATIGGGSGNVASGNYSVVPGGSNNTASGKYSLAAGRYAEAAADGVFAWADSTIETTLSSSVPNQFLVRASGGIWLYSNALQTSGVVLNSGSSAWSVLSDRNMKSNLTPVDTQAVLQSVADLPLSTWNYNAQDASIRHIGPMAQDFYASFGVGEDERHITTVDADGVALAAIQGLYQVAQGKEAQIAALQTQNAALQTRLDNLEMRLSALEQSTGAVPVSGINTHDMVLLVGLALFGGWSLRRRA